MHECGWKTKGGLIINKHNNLTKKATMLSAFILLLSRSASLALVRSKWRRFLLNRWFVSFKWRWTFNSILPETYIVFNTLHVRLCQCQMTEHIAHSSTLCTVHDMLRFKTTARTITFMSWTFKARKFTGTTAPAAWVPFIDRVVTVQYEFFWGFVFYMCNVEDICSSMKTAVIIQDYVEVFNVYWKGYT